MWPRFDCVTDLRRYKIPSPSSPGSSRSIISPVNRHHLTETRCPFQWSAALFFKEVAMVARQSASHSVCGVGILLFLCVTLEFPCPGGAAAVSQTSGNERAPPASDIEVVLRRSSDAKANDRRTALRRLEDKVIDDARHASLMLAQLLQLQKHEKDRSDLQGAEAAEAMLKKEMMLYHLLRLTEQGATVAKKNLLPPYKDGIRKSDDAGKDLSDINFADVEDYILDDARHAWLMLGKLLQLQKHSKALSDLEAAEAAEAMLKKEMMAYHLLRLREQDAAAATKTLPPHKDERPKPDDAGKDLYSRLVASHSSLSRLSSAHVEDALHVSENDHSLHQTGEKPSGKPLAVYAAGKPGGRQDIKQREMKAEHHKDVLKSTEPKKEAGESLSLALKRLTSSEPKPQQGKPTAENSNNGRPSSADSQDVSDKLDLERLVGELSNTGDPTKSSKAATKDKTALAKQSVEECRHACCPRPSGCSNLGQYKCYFDCTFYRY